MNMEQLKQALQAENIDERFVSLSGQAQDESLVLEKMPDQGWKVFYSERGQRTGERFFGTEDEACKFIFDRLSRDPTVKKRRNT